MGRGRPFELPNSLSGSALQSVRGSKYSAEKCILPVRPALNTPSMANQVPLPGVHARQSLRADRIQRTSNTLTKLPNRELGSSNSLFPEHQNIFLSCVLCASLFLERAALLSLSFFLKAYLYPILNKTTANRNKSIAKI